MNYSDVFKQKIFFLSLSLNSYAMKQKKKKHKYYELSILITNIWPLCIPGISKCMPRGVRNGRRKMEKG